MLLRYCVIALLRYRVIALVHVCVLSRYHVIALLRWYVTMVCWIVTSCYRVGVLVCRVALVSRWWCCVALVVLHRVGGVALVVSRCRVDCRVDCRVPFFYLKKKRVLFFFRVFCFSTGTGTGSGT